MNRQQLIQWKHEFRDKQGQLRKLQDFLSETSHLPPIIIDAITMKQDQLLHDLAALRERVVRGEGEVA